MFRSIRSSINSLIGSFDRRFGKSDGRPKVLSIEPTNKCNLNCPFCLVGQQNSQASVAHSALDRDWGNMSLELMQKVAKDARAFGIRTIQMHFQGEPLLHKQFCEFIRIAKKQGLRTQVFTNGLLLNPEYSRDIVRSGLDSLRFSVDGATQEVYEKNRVGGKFDVVYKNMADMVCIAKEEKSPIKLMWQFIAMSNNEHEIETARQMAQKINIPFFVKTFAESIPELSPNDPQLKRQPLLKPCKDIYRTIFAYWDGKVVPCCYDLTGKEVMGDLSTQTLKEIWNNHKYSDFRRRTDEAMLHPENEPELCKSCLKWASSAVTHGSVKNNDDV